MSITTVAKIKQIVRHFFKNIELSTFWSVLLGERFYYIMQCNAIVWCQLSSVSNGVYSKCSGSQADMAVAQHGGLIVESVWACVILSISVKKTHMEPDLGGLFQNFLPPHDLSSFCTLLMLQGQQEVPIPACAEKYTLHPGCFLFWLLHC